MANKVMMMLTNALNVVVSMESVTKKEAYCKLLDWCAVKIGIEGVYSSMKLETSNILLDAVDFNLLRSTTDDWFGKLYESVFKVKLSTIEERSAELDKYTLNKTEGFPQSILSKTVQTGRILLSICNKFDKSFLLYGIEKDVLEYHIALVNIKLYDFLL